MLFLSRHSRDRLILSERGRSSVQVRWKATPTLLPVGPSGVSHPHAWNYHRHTWSRADLQATRLKAVTAMSIGASSQPSENHFPLPSIRTPKPPSSTYRRSCRPHHPHLPIPPTSHSVFPSLALTPMRAGTLPLPRPTGKLRWVPARLNGRV